MFKVLFTRRQNRLLQDLFYSPIKKRIKELWNYGNSINFILLYHKDSNRNVVFFLPFSTTFLNCNNKVI